MEIYDLYADVHTYVAWLNQLTYHNMLMKGRNAQYWEQFWRLMWQHMIY